MVRWWEVKRFFKSLTVVLQKSILVWHWWSAVHNTLAWTVVLCVLCNETRNVAIVNAIAQSRVMSDMMPNFALLWPPVKIGEVVGEISGSINEALPMTKPPEYRTYDGHPLHGCWELGIDKKESSAAFIKAFRYTYVVWPKYYCVLVGGLAAGIVATTISLIAQSLFIHDPCYMAFTVYPCFPYCRDLKPENILLDDDGECIQSNLYCACYINNWKRSLLTDMKHEVSIRYMALMKF